MSTAIILGYQEPVDSDPNVSIPFLVLYVGNDVPSKFSYVGLMATVAKTSLSAAQSAIVAQVRTYATAQGFAVPANQCFAPSFSAF